MNQKNHLTQRERAISATAFVMMIARKDWNEDGIKAALRRHHDIPVNRLAEIAISMANDCTEAKTPAYLSSYLTTWRAAKGTATPTPTQETCGHCAKTRSAHEAYLQGAGRADPHPWVDRKAPPSVARGPNPEAMREIQRLLGRRR